MLTGMQSDPAKFGTEMQDIVVKVGRIAAVPTILDVVCRTTGMRFAAVAHVTPERWIACSVLDQINFGLTPGGELRLETTICNEIRQSHEPVVIDHVAEDARFCDHPTPAMYGFQSYISMPIILEGGSFFGTLCAIDPRPARVNNPETIGMFRLFAELIARHLDAASQLNASQAALSEERSIAELREQFMAVLGHDLRAPLRAISCFTDLILKDPSAPDADKKAKLVRESVKRMEQLVDNLTDLARGRHLGGLPIKRDANAALEPVLREIIAEYRAASIERPIEVTLSLQDPIACDRQRIAQLFSNLLGNAITYGAPDQPIRVFAATNEQGLELWVANAGEPIPEQTRPRLFDPFYRGHASPNREGLGLGLYIAHQIAIAHDGTLTVTSTPEETRFTFRMPTIQTGLGVRHQCMIYDGSPAAQLPGLVRVMAKKLGANLRVLYLNVPPMVAGLRSYLSAAGVDVAAEIDRGALILSSNDEHLVAGRFEPKPMLALLDEAVSRAIADGYEGLWAVGDMTWEFGPEKNYAKLFEYERGLEALFERRPELQGLCQYHRDTLPADVARDALYLHRACYINETLSRMSQYYAQDGPIDASYLTIMLAAQKEAVSSATR
jgi:signal transduction histidine kinase